MPQYIFGVLELSVLIAEDNDPFYPCLEPLSIVYGQNLDLVLEHYGLPYNANHNHRATQ